MSYTKNTWKSGDTVTSAKLNNIEEGIASSCAFIVHGTHSGNTITLDKTWKEIYDAVQEKCVCIIYNPIPAAVVTCLILAVMSTESDFAVLALSLDAGLAEMPFITDSEDGYPTYTLSPTPIPAPDN